MELDVVRRPVVCPRLLVQPEHVALVLSCGACGGHQEEDRWEAIPSMSVGQGKYLFYFIVITLHYIIDTCTGLL